MELKPFAAIQRTNDIDLGPIIRVDVIWTGAELDRPVTSGFCLKVTSMKLAQRLGNAINAGAVYYGAEVTRDVAGKTYVAATSRVMGKRLNADLKRLGY